MTEASPEDRLPARRRRAAMQPVVDVDDPAEYLSSPDESSPDPLPVLFEGDIVFAKITHTIEIDGQPSWFAYGIQSRVGPGESADEAYGRVAGEVNQRVLDMAVEATEIVEGVRVELEDKLAKSHQTTTRR